MLQMKTQRINCWEADVKGFTNAVGAGMRRNGPGNGQHAVQWCAKVVLVQPCLVLLPAETTSGGH